MFWEYSFSVSNLDQLLERDPLPTLDEILNEPDILDEVKGNNSKLISYLTEDDNLQSLVRNITEDSTQTKLSYDILTSNTPTIFNSFFDICSAESIRTLWDLLKDPSVDFLHLKYVVGLFDHFVDRRPNDVLQFFQNQEINYLGDLISQVKYQIVSELLLKLIGPRNDDTPPIFVSDFININGIELLLSHTISSDIATAKSALSVLTELVRFIRNESIIQNEEFDLGNRTMSILLDDMTLVSLMDFIVTNKSQAFACPAASLLCVLFNLQRIGNSNGDEFIKPCNVPSCYMKCKHNIIKVSKKDFSRIIPLLENLVNLIKDDSMISPEEDKRAVTVQLGKFKLCIIEIIVSLMLYNDEQLAREFSRLDAPNILMNLMERYPDHNIMHALVELAITAILMGYRWKTQSGTHLFLDNHLINSLLSTEYFIKKLLKYFSMKANFGGYVNQILRSLFNANNDSYHKKFIQESIESFSQEIKESLSKAEEKINKLNHIEYIESRYVRVMIDENESGSSIFQENQARYTSIEKSIEYFKNEKSHFYYDDIDENFELKMRLDLDTNQISDPFGDMVPPVISLDLNQEMFEPFKLKAMETIKKNTCSLDYIKSQSRSSLEDSLDNINEKDLHKSDSELINKSDFEKRSSTPNSTSSQDCLNIQNIPRCALSSPLTMNLDQIDENDCIFDEQNGSSDNPTD